MTLWTSRDRPPAFAWAVSLLIAWMAPVVPGAVLALAVPVVGPWLSPSMPMAMLAATAAAFALMFSPLYSWVGMLILAPLALGLSHAGRLGWGPAAAAGTVSGLCASAFVPGLSEAVPAAFGLVAGLVLRGSLHVIGRADPPVAGTGPGQSGPSPDHSPWSGPGRDAGTDPANES